MHVQRLRICISSLFNSNAWHLLAQRYFLYGSPSMLSLCEVFVFSFWRDPRTLVAGPRGVSACPRVDQIRPRNAQRRRWDAGDGMLTHAVSGRLFPLFGRGMSCRDCVNEFAPAQIVPVSARPKACTRLSGSTS